MLGLAVARSLALKGVETTVVEWLGAIGQGISSRNSEVIHAGLYYAKAPLKERFCIDGKARLYDYCTAKGVAHLRCGKLVVATRKEQLPSLEQLRDNAERVGVEVRMLSASEAYKLEPQVQCVAALHSPSTGIVDSHGLMEALLSDAKAEGSVLALRTQVIDIAVRDKVHLVVDSAGERSLAEFDTVVDASGLYAARLASRLRDDLPSLRFAKGSYFACRQRPFSRLVYPLPEPGGLGVHATVSLDGSVRFGPDVQFLDESDPDKFDYQVQAVRASHFYREIRAYWPGLRDGDLLPDYSGVRPKHPDGDFHILHTSGVISLLGFESPGLTAALAIAEQVAYIVQLDRPSRDRHLSSLMRVS